MSSQSHCPDPPPAGAVDSAALGPVRELVGGPRDGRQAQNDKHGHPSPSLRLLNRVPVHYGPWKFAWTLQVFGARHKRNTEWVILVMGIRAKVTCACEYRPK